MDALESSGLLGNCQQLIVGVKGGQESEALAERYIPDRATIIYHGIDNRNENLTIVEIEKFVKITQIGISSISIARARLAR